ncbi:hypothetical protein BU16DRAFT_531126 [Lophium mytilinum]|uniref:C3H1-type domain-containing protein n=1 Tax=Lophium mytilinum TaxID=390894 RepID=A0A6A6QC61_9PEZI|nr:hypothetical protein BU16DRAFT_531126 [Lophium mytilinum]
MASIATPSDAIDWATIMNDAAEAGKMESPPAPMKVVKKCRFFGTSQGCPFGPQCLYNHIEKDGTVVQTSLCPPTEPTGSKHRRSDQSHRAEGSSKKAQLNPEAVPFGDSATWKKKAVVNITADGERTKKENGENRSLAASGHKFVAPSLRTFHNGVELPFCPGKGDGEGAEGSAAGGATSGNEMALKYISFFFCNRNEDSSKNPATG